MARSNTIEDILLKFVYPEPNTGCWIWAGSHCRQGYGRVRMNLRMRSAHRCVYEELIAPVDGSKHMDHLCRNPWCVNPRHLEPVTPRVNAERGYSPPARNMRKTHCKEGHPLSGVNLRMARNGRKRLCVICIRRLQREWHMLKRRAGGVPELGKKPNCKYGHPLSGDNLYMSPSGDRLCRECSRQRGREYYQRHGKKKGR